MTSPGPDRPDPIPPGACIGVLGGGQLGRMLATAASRLGFEVHIFTPEDDSPAGRVAAKTTVADWSDIGALQRFADAVDVATYEFENIPVAAAKTVAERTRLRPGVESLERTQDRLTEKRFIDGLGLQPAAFHAVASQEALDRAVEAVGLPAILKTRRFGYDGKGQARLKGAEDLPGAFAKLGGGPCVLEALIPFEREISIVLARTVSGDVIAFDPVENRHAGGVLATSTVPAGISDATRRAAKQDATALADALGHVGVMAVEFFVLEDGALRVNEIAPRVHNSGHWTADACDLCQFEAHIRAICGWPLPKPIRHSDVTMTNLLGSDADDWRALAGESSARLTLYGKRSTKPGRKMGHISRLRRR